MKHSVTITALSLGLTTQASNIPRQAVSNQVKFPLYLREVEGGKTHSYPNRQAGVAPTPRPTRSTPASRARQSTRPALPHRTSSSPSSSGASVAAATAVSTQRSSTMSSLATASSSSSTTDPPLAPKLSPPPSPPPPTGPSRLPEQRANTSTSTRPAWPWADGAAAVSKRIPWGATRGGRRSASSVRASWTRARVSLSWGRSTSLSFTFWVGTVILRRLL